MLLCVQTNVPLISGQKSACFVLESRSHVDLSGLEILIFLSPPLPKCWDYRHCRDVSSCVVYVVWGIEFVHAEPVFYQLSYPSSRTRVSNGIPQWVSFSPSPKFSSYLFSTYYLPSKLSHTSQLPSGHSVASYLSKHGLIVHPKMTTQVYTTNIESPSPCWVLF